MNEIPAVSHLPVLLDDQAHAHTYEQQKGTCSRCGFLCGAYVWTVQRKGRAWIVDQRKFFLLFQYLVNAVLSVGAGLAVSEAVFLLCKRGTNDTVEREDPCAKGFCPRGKDGNKVSVAKAGNIHHSVFICLDQLWSRILITNVEYRFQGLSLSSVCAANR